MLALQDWVIGKDTGICGPPRRPQQEGPNDMGDEKGPGGTDLAILR